MKYEKTKNISFPIGGIGSGCIGLAGNGELNDWEIFNRPSKNTRNGYSHFAIKATRQGKTIVKVLHGDTNENLIGMHRDGSDTGFGTGPKKDSMAGFPHFRKVDFDADFPIAHLTYQDEDFPAVVRLCAFNPLIPHDEFNSSLPVGFFEWEIENTTQEDIEYAISFSVQNPADVSKNQALSSGCFLACADKQKEELGYFDLTVLTDNADSVAQAYWYRGDWQDAITTFWNNFSQCERMQPRDYKETGKNDHASIVSYLTVPANGKRKTRFVLAWNAPMQYSYWWPCKDEAGQDRTWKNYYATQFENSTASAKYALENFDTLQQKTQRFADALHGSNLPDFVKDAVSANLSVLKSPTVWRLEDGSFWGWEGVFETTGSCEGSCQHVWNYAYALPFLFPSLERSMRENTIKYATYENGETAFRIQLPLGAPQRKYRACVDGQMGEVIKCYREWKISGDSKWLEDHADGIFKMLEYAWEETNEDAWDKDCDGVIDGRQHHTLDVELFGANSWLQGFYLLALDCASKMAEALGQSDRAEKYKGLYQKGRAWTNEHLFNGEYFGQKIDLADKTVIDKFVGGDYYWNDETQEIKYQIGEGCIIDQVLADWHASLLGVGEVFDTDKKRTALKSLYKYNYKPSMREVTNMWRNFALNDEAGTIICSYPDGKQKPMIPIPYCEETMTGFEYALGGLMISQGLVSEGENVVKAVRNRYNGENRNPFNEIECGNNYARSMASYALLPIYSGFSFDMTKNYLGFAPINKADGRYFWSVGNAYGSVEFSGDRQTLFVFGKEIFLSSFGLKDDCKIACVRVDGNEIPFKQTKNLLSFEKQAIKESLVIERKAK